MTPLLPYPTNSAERPVSWVPVWLSVKQGAYWAPGIGLGAIRDEKTLESTRWYIPIPLRLQVYIVKDWVLIYKFLEEVTAMCSPELAIDAV